MNEPIKKSPFGLKEYLNWLDFMPVAYMHLMLFTCFGLMVWVFPDFSAPKSDALAAQASLCFGFGVGAVILLMIICWEWSSLGSKAHSRSIDWRMKELKKIL